MKKPLLTGALIIIAILAILPFWAGYKAQAQIEQQLTSFNQRIAPLGVHIEISDYQRGYLSSDLSIKARFAEKSQSSNIHIEHAPLTLTGFDIARAKSRNTEAATKVHYSITGQLDITQSIPAYAYFPGGSLAWQGTAAHFPDRGHLTIDTPAIHVPEVDVDVAPIHFSADIEEQQIALQLPELSIKVALNDSEDLQYHYEGIHATIPLQTIAGKKYALGVSMRADSIKYEARPLLHLAIAPYSAKVGFRPDGDTHYTFNYITHLDNIDLDLDTTKIGVPPEMAAYNALLPNTFHTDISISGITAESVVAIAHFVALSLSPETFDMDSVELDNYLADYFDRELRPVLAQNVVDEAMRLHVDIDAHNEQHQLTIKAEGVEGIDDDDTLEVAQNSTVSSDIHFFDGSHANISISADLFAHPLVKQLGITPPPQLQLSEDGQTYQLNAEIRDGTTYINGKPTDF